jgi:hypothetical protein
MQEQTSGQRVGLTAVQALMEEAGDRLEHADSALRAQVFRALGVQVRVPQVGPEGEPLAVQVSGTDVLGLLGVDLTPDLPGVLSFEKRTSR